MSNVKSLEPMQALRAGMWIENVVPLIKNHPRVRATLAQMGEMYLVRMASVLEGDLSPEDLSEEIQFLAYEFHVRCKSYHWLVDHFDAHDLVDLTLVLAEELFPKETWQIVDNEKHEVVVNRERSMVVDLVHGDRLSALASLAYSGDEEARKNPRALKEIEELEEEFSQQLQQSLAKARADLARFSAAGEVLDFPQE